MSECCLGGRGIPVWQALPVYPCRHWQTSTSTHRAPLTHGSRHTARCQQTHISADHYRHQDTKTWTARGRVNRNNRHTHTHTHTHTFTGHFSETTRVGRYQKGKTNLDFTEARDCECGSSISWAICKSAPRSRQITTPAPQHSVFLQAGCSSCRLTNSVKALKAFNQNNRGRR